MIDQSGIQLNDLPPEFRDIAETIGMEPALKLVQACDGEGIYIPCANFQFMTIRLKALRQRIEALPHGKNRTAGTGMLYHAYRLGISRREFNDLVVEVRRETNRQQSAALCRVVWQRPDLTWALDEFEYGQCHV